jgi:hypothetical protein
MARKIYTGVSPPARTMSPMSGEPSGGKGQTTQGKGIADIVYNSYELRESGEKKGFPGEEEIDSLYLLLYNSIQEV